MILWCLPSLPCLKKSSKAPHVVAAIYADDELESECKDVLATMFMGLYRTYTKGGVLRVPPPDTD